MHHKNIHSETHVFSRWIWPMFTERPRHKYDSGPFKVNINHNLHEADDRAAFVATVRPMNGRVEAAQVSYI